METMGLGISETPRLLQNTVDGVIGGINATLTESLDLYYLHAGHRQLPIDQYIHSKSQRDVLFLRGMMHFEPAETYANVFRGAGYQFRTTRFSSTAESNKLRPLAYNVIDLLILILRHPEYLKDDQTLIGHSAGGNELLQLRALARKKDPGRILKSLPYNQTLWSLLCDDRITDRAATQLARALFLAEGSPLMGVELTIPGRVANRVIVEGTVPGLLHSITRDAMNKTYDTLDLDPRDAVDGLIYSSTAPLNFSSHGNPRSLAAHALTQGAYRVFSPFLKRSKPHDGIVPESSARLSWTEEQRALREMKVHFDHLGMVEYAEAAACTLHLMDRLRGMPSVTN